MNIQEAVKNYFSNADLRSQAIADLAEIIAIPSVAGDPDGKFPYGKACADALDKAAEIAGKYGFKVENHDYHCLSVLYGDSEKEVGIVCHLDVVPAGDGWSVEPYALTEKDGLLIGRGTHDDKGPFIQGLYTLRFFKENNIKLPFTIRLILGSDEEVGSTDLRYFQTVRKPPMFSFTPDSSFPVCIGEKGILSVWAEFPALSDNIKEFRGGTVSNAVAGAAYAIVDTDKPLSGNENITISKCENLIRIDAKGKSAHAAMPESGVNAISLLADYILKNQIVDNNKTLEFIRASTCEYLGKTLGIDAENKDFGYLTCVGGVINGNGEKTVLSYNIRYLPDTPSEDIISTIKKAIEPYGGRVSSAHASEGYFVSADDKKIVALTSACEDVLLTKCEPYTMGGGTYARSLPNTVAFGSGIESERYLLGDERGNAHQRDEYISVKELFMGMEIYSLAIGNLSDIL